MVNAYEAVYEVMKVLEEERAVKTWHTLMNQILTLLIKNLKQAQKKS